MASSKTINLTGLGAVYAGDDPLHFDAALQSLYSQTVSLSEIVLVQDGEVDEAITSIIQKWEEHLPIKLIRLPQNKGLANALNLGLKACSYDFVMRFDADDINRRERAEIQSSFLLSNADISIVSGDIEEFQDSPGDLGMVRYSSREMIDAKRLAVWRNPINHAASCFRRDHIIGVGGYPSIPFMEDYGLWLSCIKVGKKIASVDGVMVDVRVGAGMHSRRSGIKHIKSEYAIFKSKLKVFGLLAISCYFSFFFRSSVRFLPAPVWKRIYSMLRG